ncbi:MAG: hypothetical protein KDA41_03525, partial [Planctomycetales bacterium]|nr:hypothetical protein [Planctomycetales bacterium]
MTSASLQQEATSQLFELPRRLETHEGLAECAAAMRLGKPCTLDGAWGSSCALTAAALARSAPGPLVVVLPQAGAIDDFIDDCALFSHTGCERFPAWEAEPGERVLHDEIYGDRLRTLKLLLPPQSAAPSASAKPVIVTCMQA